MHEVMKTKHVQLSISEVGHIFSLSEINLDNIDLSSRSSTIEVLRVGKIMDRGLEITEKMLNDYVENFNNKIYVTDLQVDLRHDRDGEAAAWFKEVYVDKSNTDGLARLMAVVEWTSLGEEKIAKKLYRYTSAELAPTYTAQNGKEVENVLIGCALTNIPAVKGMEAVSLSEQTTLFFNSQNSMKTKLAETLLSMADDHKAIMAKDKVSKSDMKGFTKEHGDNAGHDAMATAQQNKYDAQKGGGSSKADDEDDEEASEKDDDKEEASEKEEASTKDRSVISLQERLNKQEIALAEEKKKNEDNTKKLFAMAEEIDNKKLSEQVNTNIMLSVTNKIGLHKKNLELATKFLKGKSEEDRAAFFALVKQLQFVDLSVIGSSEESDLVLNGTDELAELNKKAEEMHAANPKKPLHECMSEVFRSSPEANKR